MLVDIRDEYIEELKKLAKSAIPWDTEEGSEEFDIYEACGGNFDDAYEIGGLHASIEGARAVLMEIDILWGNANEIP